MSERIAVLQQMMREKPDDPFLLYALALEYRSAGKYDQSRSFFERLLQDHPDYLPIYYQFGNLAEDLGDIPLATRLYQEGIVKALANGEQKTANELKQALEMLG